jgi:hypothetical protein
MNKVNVTNSKKANKFCLWLGLLIVCSITIISPSEAVVLSANNFLAISIPSQVSIPSGNYQVPNVPGFILHNLTLAPGGEPDIYVGFCEATVPYLIDDSVSLRVSAEARYNTETEMMFYIRVFGKDLDAPTPLSFMSLSNFDLYYGIDNAYIGQVNVQDAYKFLSGDLSFTTSFDPLTFDGSAMLYLDSPENESGEMSFSGTGKLFGAPIANAIGGTIPRNNQLWCKGHAAFPPVFPVFDANFDLKITKNGDGTHLNGDLNGTLQTPSLPVVGSISLASVHANFNNHGFSGSVPVAPLPKELCTPKVCVPLIGCTPSICVPNPAYFSFDLDFSYMDGKFSFAGIPFKKIKDSNPWEFSSKNKLYEDVDGGTFQFMTNWKVIEKTSTRSTQPFRLTQTGMPVTTLTIPENTDGCIFVISYSNVDVSDVVASLTLPDGTMLDLADGLLPTGYETYPGFTIFNPEGQDASFWLYKPVAGEYTVTIENAETLGEYSVELLVEEENPEIAITSVVETDTPGIYQIAWSDNRSNVNAKVSLYLDKEREEQNGIFITEFDADTTEKSYLIDTNNLNISTWLLFCNDEDP